MGVSFERGVFVLSLDFELVWGSRDLMDQAVLGRSARVTREEVFPALLGQLTRHGMRATWATVGELFLERGGPEIQEHLVAPQHAWLKRPWLEGIPSGDERSHPGFYGRSLIRRLLEAEQEVGSHGFTHAILGDEGCSSEVARSELDASVRVARELGIELESFVFPRNQVGHLDQLAAHGFRCWRGADATWYAQRGVPRPAARAAHLADVARGKAAPTVMPWLDEFGMWCIPGSASFLPIEGVRGLIPISRRVQRAVDCVERAAVDRRIAHLWLHPINLASDPTRLLDMLGQVLDQVARLRDQGRIQVMSMAEVARHAAEA